MKLITDCDKRTFPHSQPLLAFCTLSHQSWTIRTGCCIERLAKSPAGCDRLCAYLLAEVILPNGRKANYDPPRFANCAKLNATSMSWYARCAIFTLSLARSESKYVTRESKLKQRSSESLCIGTARSVVILSLSSKWMVSFCVETQQKSIEENVLLSTRIIFNFKEYDLIIYFHVCCLSVFLKCFIVELRFSRPIGTRPHPGNRNTRMIDQRVCFWLLLVSFSSVRLTFFVLNSQLWKTRIEGYPNKR